MLKIADMRTSNGGKIHVAETIKKIIPVLLDTIDDGLIVTDHLLQIVWCNTRFSKLTGIRIVNEGQKFLELVHLPDADFLLQQLTYPDNPTNKLRNGFQTLIQPCGSKSKSLPATVHLLQIEESKHLLFVISQYQASHLQRLMQIRLSAQEALKEKIGKELHDNINQLLTSVKLYQGLALDSEEMRVDLIRKANSILIEAMQEIRDLSHALVGMNIKEKGLVAAIEDTLERIKNVNRFTIHFHYQGITEQLSPKIKLSVLRIIQEQLSNIVKHSLAKNIYVSIKADHQLLTLSVADDGIGLEKKKVSGIGFSNIASRLKLLKGKYKIESEPGKGCKLIATIPLSLKTKTGSV